MVGGGRGPFFRRRQGERPSRRVRAGQVRHAVGLTEGSLVTVLRKAPLSGPLHVRVSEHTELAIDRELALNVEVTPPWSMNERGGALHTTLRWIGSQAFSVATVAALSGSSLPTRWTRQWSSS